MQRKVKSLTIYSGLLIFILFSFLYAGCNKNSNSEIEDFKLNDTFHIKYNQTLLNQEHELSITMDSVIEDSRCPLYFTCVWEGNAKVKFGFKVKEKYSEFILDTHDPSLFSRDTIINEYYIELIKLDPYPVNTEIINQKDYIAKLIVKKL